jgi:anti-sigma B factor antagonist
LPNLLPGPIGAKRLGSATPLRVQGRHGGRLNFELSEVVSADARVVSIRGEFDRAVVERAEYALAIASADRERVLVIDLTGCTFLDTTAIAAIVGAARALTNGQIRIAIACLPDTDALAMLELAGIDRTITILDSVEAALVAALTND